MAALPLQSREEGLRARQGIEPFTGVIVGAQADEEGSRSKERYFSPRNRENSWDVGDQPPEFWNQYKTDFAPGTHLRIHPLLDWTELNIWEYIERENIPTVSLYYNHGDGIRYRSLCGPCTRRRIRRENVQEIIVELKTGKFAGIAERSGRAQTRTMAVGPRPSARWVIESPLTSDHIAVEPPPPPGSRRARSCSRALLTHCGEFGIQRLTIPRATSEPD
jgi:3'-phosphoadenosine 5'-phosphosulfate sulfotransferase (PAPS reductase)/FAD synthetase